MEKIIKKCMANITYSGLTYNTLLILEYEHTGKLFYYKKGKDNFITDNPEIAINQKKITKTSGYYFIKRIAIPTINAKGQKDIWYINNSGDSYVINKVSKYGKKIHEQMQKETILNNP